MKYLIKTCRDGRDQRQRAYNLVCFFQQPHSTQSIPARLTYQVSTCYLTPTASTTSTTSAKLGSSKRNQGRILSISVEQKYRVLHRRCGGVCVRDGCESNDGVVYARQKQSIRSQRSIPRKRADGGGRISRPSSERDKKRVVGGKRCLRLERRRRRRKSRRSGPVILALLLNALARYMERFDFRACFL